jgi:hypothetical protein
VKGLFKQAFVVLGARHAGEAVAKVVGG